MSDPDLEDLAPSAKLVYKVLDYYGPQTQKQLVEETMLPPRTVRYALSKLEARGVVESDIHIPDARQRVYSLPSHASVGSST